MGLAQGLNDHYQIEVTPALFFAYPSLSEFADYLLQTFGNTLFTHYQTKLPTSLQIRNTIEVNANRANTVNASILPAATKRLSLKEEDDAIAIIGLSGVFPQSPDAESLWSHLAANHDLISEIPLGRWDGEAYYDASGEQSHKSYSKWGGFVEDVAGFDAGFFNISPREAELMDPQQRLFLQTVWQTVESAGYSPLSLSGEGIGVFVGVQFSEYQSLLSQAGISDALGATGNSQTMLANRVSYFMDWHGPSEAIDTACSSSLVAIHHAVQAIRNGECGQAIAGGVSLMLSPDTFVATSRLGVLSKEGRCKTFDAQADGYVKGEGVGALLLKPLSQAQADKDNILGIIRGSAVKHGGKAQSLTAPNAKIESELLIEAYLQANIPIETVSYIETHGTGTKLGDPAEIEGLKLAFSKLQQSSLKNHQQHQHPHNTHHAILWFGFGEDECGSFRTCSRNSRDY